MNRAQRRATAKKTNSQSKVGISALAVSSLVAGNIALLPPGALAVPTCEVDTLGELSTATLNNACTTITITANLNFSAAEGIIIDHDVLIQGDVSGSAAVIDANGLDQIFVIDTQNVAQHSDDGDIDVTLKNLVLREGEATDLTEVSGRNYVSGGAVSATYIDSTVDVPVALVLDGVSFNDNTANNEGGAVYIEVGSITTTGTTSFTSNYAEDDGGALYVELGNVTMSGTTSFTSNYAGKDGGAIHVLVGNISNSGTASFSNNSNDSSYERFSRGGAIFISEGSLSSTSSITFTGNSNGYDGGAVYVDDGNITFSGTSTFTSNTSGDDGGVIYADNGNVTISGTSTFTDNDAGEDAGAIYVQNGDLIISGTSTFTNNHADENGGAIYVNDNVFISGTATFTSNSADDDGGAIYTFSSSVVISGTATFTSNSADDDGGAIYSDQDVIISGTATFTSNSADDDGGAVYVEDYFVVSGTATFTSNISGSDGGAVYAENDPVYFSGNSNVRFINNTASHEGGALYSEGNVIHIFDNAYVLFQGNAAGHHGGAIDTDGNDLLVGDQASVIFRNNSAGANGGAVEAGNLRFEDDARVVFESNSADNGGAVYLGGGIESEPSVNLSFIGNDADYDGGAIFAFGPVVLSSSYFGDNSANENGGAILSRSNVIIANSTFFNNRAGDEGGAINVSDDPEGSQVILSTFLDNTADGVDGDTPGQSIFTGQVFKLLGNIFASSSAGLPHLGEAMEYAPDFRDYGGNFSTSDQDTSKLNHSTSKIVTYENLAISSPPINDANYPNSTKVIPIAAESFAADGVDLAVLADNIALLSLGEGALPTVDQRGAAREMKYDSGSYEVGMRVMPVEVVIAPKVVLPSAPPRVIAKRDGRNALKVEWSTPTTAGTGKILKYEIYRNGKKVATLPSTARSFRDTGLDSNQSYTYRVVTIGSQGSSIKSINSNAIFPRR